jgi:hypothetical protein
VRQIEDVKRLTAVKVLPGQKLQLRFDDGVAGTVDLSAEAGKEIFAPWKDPDHFASVKIGHNGRSLEWPHEIDLCADALYLEITGKVPEELFPDWLYQNTNA